MSRKHSQNSTIFTRLNTRIVIYFLAFAFLPLLSFSILGYYLNKELITRINMNQLESINESSAKQFDAYLVYKSQILKHAYSDFKNSKKTKSLSNFLKSYNKNNSDFSKIEVADSEIFASGKYFETNESVSDTLFPILYETDNYSIIGYQSLPEMRELFQLNVKEIQNIAYILNNKKKLTEFTIKSLNNDEISTLMSHIQRAENHEVHNFEDDTKYIYAFTFLRSNNILFITKVDKQSFYTELVTFRNIILIANIIFAVLLIFLAILSSQRITTPLQKLIKATQNIGKGYLDQKIEIATNDEIQILANEFELMRNRLQESYQGMEEEIEKRTKELKEAQSQISHQEKMASLGMMAAGIAHEIGNPLTSISSMVQVIKRKHGEPLIAEYVSNILKNIERISRIVRELVDFSRPSSLDEAPLDVNEIIRSAVGIIKYDRRSKNLNYELSLDSKLPETVLVSDHLLQVFLNILINAVDASEDSGEQITVTSFSRNGSIYVDITDDGIGIAAESQNKIFEPFYTTKGVGKGTGLGLTVSYGLIKKVGGEIKVNSEAGKGSKFSVIIPVRSYVEDKNEI